MTKKISVMPSPFKIFVITLIAFLIGFRIALPGILLKFAENQINKIPEYHVTIKDVDVNLLAGSYTLIGINLVKIKKKIPVPFFAADAVKFSVQWKALLHGALVAKIYAVKPVINLVVDPHGNNEQLSINSQWEKAVQSLMPLNFTHVEIVDGQLTYQSFTARPAFKLSLNKVNFEVDNLQNIDNKKQLLSSSFSGTAVSKQGSPLVVNGKFNPFAKTPTFYLTSSLKGMPVTEAKNFLRHYTAINVQRGSFSLFVELNAAQGRIVGCAKPFIKGIKIQAPKNANPIEALYNGALDIIAKILTNSKQKTVATQVNLSGRIDDPNTSVLSIIGYLLTHAFIRTLLPQVDHKVKMQDVYYRR